MTTTKSTTPRATRKSVEPASEENKQATAPVTSAAAASAPNAPAVQPASEPRQRVPRQSGTNRPSDTQHRGTAPVNPNPTPRPADQSNRPASNRPAYQSNRPVNNRPANNRPADQSNRPVNNRPASQTNRPANARVVSGIAAEGPQHRTPSPQRSGGNYTNFGSPQPQTGGNRNTGNRDRRDNRGGGGSNRPNQSRPSGIGNRIATRSGPSNRGHSAPRGGPSPMAPRKPEKPATPTLVEIPRQLTVKELSDLLNVGSGEVIKALMSNGMMATINQQIDYETAAIVAADLGYETKEQILAEQMVGGRYTPSAIVAQLEAPDEAEALKPRPPIVTIMGHVDHGKTSLLDAIRSTNVTAGEAGGITQHIGAYQVEIHGQKITFLDTPGHEAFTAMRARGAQVTDIAVIVVAADDGVMPQTIEAINHARAANVALIIAMNKMDKPDANPDRVKQQLADRNVLVEEWGGDVPCVEVSAKQRKNIDGVLEMILLVAELLELKANPDRPAIGAVVEAELDKTRGPKATILVKNGTLKVSDVVVVGPIFGKIRAMLNDKGKPIRKADPSTPAEILGLEDVPQAGDQFLAVPDEKTARQIVMERMREHQVATEGTGARPISLDAIFNQIQEGQVKELNVILKADVQGSIEAIKASLERLSTDQVKVNIIHTGAGSITESDILLASASSGIIIGFNTRTEPSAKRLAEAEKVDVREYNIIYNLVDDVKKALSGLLEPTIIEVVEGHAEVRQVYKLGKGETIAGCMVTDGRIIRNALARVVRGGTVVHEGRITSLKRFKDDVREVATGFECGLSIEGFSVEVGDIVECYSKSSVSQTID